MSKLIRRYLTIFLPSLGFSHMGVIKRQSSGWLFVLSICGIVYLCSFGLCFGDGYIRRIQFTQWLPVSDAVVSAMQYCPPCNTVRSRHFCISNRVRGYAKTVRRTCTWLCARVNERACTYSTYMYMQHEYTRIMIAANTQRPNISHVIYDTHLACKKNYQRVPSTKGV